MKKPQPHWIGLGAWFAIVAAAVVACSGGTDGRFAPGEGAAAAGAAAPAAPGHR
jgi:hypothetical protein